MTTTRAPVLLIFLNFIVRLCSMAWYVVIVFLEVLWYLSFFRFIDLETCKICAIVQTKQSQN
jgi:hypothetical protein